MLTSDDVRVLVTGCAGFIGSHLSERLLAEGHDVIGIDALTDSYDPDIKLRNLGAPLESNKFHFVRRDLLDADCELLDGVEIVFHLAARPGVRTSWGQEFEEYVHANILGTQHLLECSARAAGLRRIVYTSSSSVYGNRGAERTTEDDPKHPISPYGVTKLAAEHLCAAYTGAAGGAPVTCLRLFTVYGPRQRPDMAFYKLIGAALEGSKFVLYGDGSQQRDFTYVADVVEALVHAASREAAGFEVFNVAGGSVVSMNEAIAMVEQLAGTKIAIERAGQQSGDVRNTAADLSKSRATLGYAPRIALREGLCAQIAHQRGS